MEAYREAKARLFRDYLTAAGVGVINVDGEGGEWMLGQVRGRGLAVSARRDGRAEVRPRALAQTVDGSTVTFTTPAGEVEVRSPLIGAFNLENLAVAVGIGVALGLGAEAIGQALSGVAGVPGRLERVANGAGIGVFVDYAHTPDALERVMAALRPITRGRLIVVFGCGGDRDKTKRPIMGRLVARDADLPIVTSDNPRTEDAQAILDMIVAGVHELRADGFVVERDRRAAIEQAIATARAGDVVLIAGKGHEDYQIVGKTKHHFDDREEAGRALAKLANRPPNGQD
jgi:UDP-N-acetylmuramoyl-L-alanyl-D-glutamate--2,6-diaminopimelate ligase